MHSNTHLSISWQQASWIPWLLTALPILAVGGAYAIALAQGFNSRCIPFIEGCTSISRAARYEDAIFWFRALMMPVSVLLVIYWYLEWRQLKQFTSRKLTLNCMLTLGIVAALALVLYANFLGTDGHFYRFLRRFGVTFYFGFSLLAQLLCVYLNESARIFYKTDSQKNTKVLRLIDWQKRFVILQWFIGLISLIILIWQPEFKDQADNIIEWNMALLMTLFYGVRGFAWRLIAIEPCLTPKEI
jgi:hypothetical protein